MVNEKEFDLVLRDGIVHAVGETVDQSLNMTREELDEILEDFKGICGFTQEELLSDYIGHLIKE